MLHYDSCTILIMLYYNELRFTILYCSVLYYDMICNALLCSASRRSGLPCLVLLIRPNELALRTYICSALPCLISFALLD